MPMFMTDNQKIVGQAMQYFPHYNRLGVCFQSLKWGCAVYRKAVYTHLTNPVEISKIRNCMVSSLPETRTDVQFFLNTKGCNKYT